MSKRSADNDNSKSKKPKELKPKAAPYSWGSPGCYTKFIEECKLEKQRNKGKIGNVFDSGIAKDHIAAKMNSVYPGCGREVIRSKLRQESVIEDLANCDIIGML
jgi:hypothetical protein